MKTKSLSILLASLIFALTASYIVIAKTITETGVSTDILSIPGSVGIGTTSPGQKLSVAGAIESTSGGFKFPDATIQTTAYAGGTQTVVAGNVSSGAFGSNTGGGNYSFPANVGIGTASPGAKLDVQGGDIKVGSSVTIKGDGSVSTGLNAAKVGGYTAAELLAAGGGSYPVFAGTFFENGGIPYYCKKRVVDTNGYSSLSNINNASFCNTGNYTCCNGTCIPPGPTGSADGVDNNCNGIIDESWSQTRTCWPGGRQYWQGGTYIERNCQNYCDSIAPGLTVNVSCSVITVTQPPDTIYFRYGNVELFTDAEWSGGSFYNCANTIPVADPPLGTRPVCSGGGWISCTCSGYQ